MDTIGGRPSTVKRGIAETIYFPGTNPHIKNIPVRFRYIMLQVRFAGRICRPTIKTSRTAKNIYFIGIPSVKNKIIIAS